MTFDLDEIVLPRKKGSTLKEWVNLFNSQNSSPTGKDIVYLTCGTLTHCGTEIEDRANDNYGGKCIPSQLRENNSRNE